ncbi:MAG: tRNA pseudouridine(38-40) synthase TruA [Planctomycetota bacterium]
MSSQQTEGANYRIDLAYDGRAYHGWQRHQGNPTVQGALEGAIESCFGTKSPAHSSGRTDRGVHANHQVANVFLPDGLDVEEARTALQAALPDDIQLLALAPAPADFHARGDAKNKTYRYIIWNGKDCPDELDGRAWHIPQPLNIKAMRPVCRIFEGVHDFASFAKKTRTEQKNTNRRIHSIKLEHDPDAPARIEITIRADGFLWKMVRNIVYAIVRVGEGHLTAERLKEVLESTERLTATGTAPAAGLYLDRVEY